MTEPEWKPGDVAMVSGVTQEFVATYVEGNCLLGCAAGYNSQPHWHADGGALSDAYDARPLVVIDPEDREQVRAIADEAFPDVRSNTNRLQAALRSLIEAPKPEEPQGLGAVVEGKNGDRWTRIDGGTAARRWVCEADDRVEPRRWSDIAAVHILSEGVTP